ncbi:hypothetical protein AX774_g1544 [Zancudomyces culisetae]|uniref:Uncharacterized protein n=1 Tax=Zancudomyces culisetae TaxID=1213189 RepID=A0A1R1PVG2_ZANCU|nr:hypothetical protein AX774_g1544 [Zancudomyces culisetae]|eukprot:OMH84931.1 hypothetical protein AX774_g1544 [Zancudomyces culisetae]
MSANAIIPSAGRGFAPRTGSSGSLLVIVVASIRLVYLMAPLSAIITIAMGTVNTPTCEYFANGAKSLKNKSGNTKIIEIRIMTIRRSMATPDMNSVEIAVTMSPDIIKYVMQLPIPLKINAKLSA